MNDSTASKFVAIGCRFSKSRKLSRNLAGRLHNYLRAQQQAGIGDALARERMLVASLPDALQVDIYAEIRTPVLTELQFFRRHGNVQPPGPAQGLPWRDH